MSARALRPVRILSAAALAVAGAVAMTAYAHAGPAAPAKEPTMIAAGTAKLALLPPSVTNLNAQLGDRTGRPLPGHLITFATTDGTVLCKAKTNQDGRATCDSTSTLSSVGGLRSGYVAKFAGNARYLKAVGYGTVNPV